LRTGTVDTWFQDPTLNEIRDNPHLAPDVIAFLERSILILGSVEGQFRVHANVGAVAGGYQPNEGWVLEVMLALVWQACLVREWWSRARGARDLRPLGEELNQLLAFSGGVPTTDHL